ncbi:MAG TPA: FtsQ-type POTRA domain-containing protein [Candidatus Hydrogenedentes bacterium]|nr:FtsQ-type POTRA domain-containing protein [Candidatus Hydrogenedentota bacterium]HNT88195.1 FtsQ-type POTRA domain-containing protein [Candidatus Hydrogenedentota bacterium]
MRYRIVRRLIEGAIGLAVLLALGLFAYSYVRESPFLRVQWLRIEGARRVDPRTIRAVAGITEKHNVLLLDVEAVRDRVERIPYVRQCVVRRVYPDVVFIRVEEREPLATLMVNNRLFEIDAEGVVLEEISATARKTGPFISSVRGLGYVQEGDWLTHPSLLGALDVWRAFNSVPVSRDVTVSEIAALSPNEILMYCNDFDFEIRWGRAGSEEQAKRLDIFWRVKGSRIACNEYIDLRFNGEVVCR